MTPPPNFKPGIGRLSTDRYDFQSHLQGQNPPGYTDFRHTADQTDMNPPVLGGATTVQSSLENIAAFIASQSGAGQGFVTVGDGYNTWVGTTGSGPGASGNFNINTPSLDTLLNPVFASIVAFQTAVLAGGNPAPVIHGFERIQMGGVIVIKAGTYIVKKTINVPPGITLLGEGYGTKIINATNLNTSTLPPIPLAPIAISNATNASPIVITTVVPVPNLATGDIVHISGVVGNLTANSAFTINPFVVTVTGSNSFSLNGTTGSGAYTPSTGFVTTIKPLFKILADNNRGSNDFIIDTAGFFGFERETRILNMVIADNFTEPTILGDVYYKLPQNYTANVGGAVFNPPGLILQESGSSLVLDQVELIGRNGASKWTGSAIWLDATIPASTGSNLKILSCLIDGFSVPVVWLNPAGGADYLEVTESKIRANGDYVGLSTAGNNTIIITNDCTSKITNNVLYGDGANILCAVYINGSLGSAPALQSRGKTLLAMNDIIVNKGGGSNVIFTPILTNGITSAYISLMEYGNNFQDSFDVNIDGVAALQVTSSLVKISTPASIPIVSGDTAFNNNINVLGDADFENNINVDGYAKIDGYATVAGTLTASSTLVASGQTFFNDGVYGHTVTPVSAGTYFIDSTNPARDFMVLVPTNLGACIVQLPPTTGQNGRILIIKDNGNASSTNTITIYPQTGTNIEGLSINLPYIITTPFTAVTLVCISSTWWIV